MAPHIKHKVTQTFEDIEWKVVNYIQRTEDKGHLAYIIPIPVYGMVHIPSLCY